MSAAGHSSASGSGRGPRRAACRPRRCRGRASRSARSSERSGLRALGHRGGPAGLGAQLLARREGRVVGAAALHHDDGVLLQEAVLAEGVARPAATGLGAAPRDCTRSRPRRFWVWSAVTVTVVARDRASRAVGLGEGARRRLGRGCSRRRRGRAATGSRAGAGGGAAASAGERVQAEAGTQRPGAAAARLERRCAARAVIAAAAVATASRRAATTRPGSRTSASSSSTATQPKVCGVERPVGDQRRVGVDRVAAARGASVPRRPTSSPVSGSIDRGAAAGAVAAPPSPAVAPVPPATRSAGRPVPPASGRPAVGVPSPVPSATAAAVGAAAVDGCSVPVSVPHGPSPGLVAGGGLRGDLGQQVLFEVLAVEGRVVAACVTSRSVRSTPGSAFLSLAIWSKPACTRLSGSGE